MPLCIKCCYYCGCKRVRCINVCIYCPAKLSKRTKASRAKTAARLTESQKCHSWAGRQLTVGITSTPLRIALPVKMAPKYTISWCFLVTGAFYKVKKPLWQKYPYASSSSFTTTSFSAVFFYILFTLLLSICCYCCNYCYLMLFCNVAFCLFVLVVVVVVVVVSK